MLDTTTPTAPTTTTFAEPFAAPVLPPPMTLPEAINAAHDAAKGAGRTMLLKAKEAGDLLLQAKSECAHGAFKAWIEENCAFSYDTANDYMKVAKNGACSTFDPGMSIRAFLEAHTTPRDKASAQATNAAKAKPATASASGTTKVSELKAEIGRLAGELQAARDALATAEAHIKTLQEASGGPVVSLEDACGLHDAPPSSPLITAEELATLRQDIRDYEEMYDGAQADRKALKEEVSELKRQLHKAVAASPKAAQALRPKDLDENGLDMNDARNW